MGSAFRLYDPNDPFAIMRLRRKLEESQASDGVDIPVKPGIPTPKDPIDELYENGPRANDYESYVQHPPERRAPASTDRVLAALSSALDQRPHDRFGKINEVLDRPHQLEVEDYKLKGEGLRAAAQMEGQRQGKKIARQSHLETLEERRQNHEETLQERRLQHEEAAKDRDENRKQAAAQAEAQLKQRQAEAQSRAEDRALSREERVAARKESNDIKRELIDLRREQFNNKPKPEDKETWAYDSEANENVRASEKDIQEGKLQKSVGDTAIQKEKFLRDVDNRFTRLLALTKKHPEWTGQAQGKLTGLSNYTGVMSNPEKQEMQRLAESLRADKLREQAGTALTPTELDIYNPVLTALDQGDMKLAENILGGMRSTRGMMKRKNHPFVEGLDPVAPLGADKDGWIVVNGIRMREKR